MTREPLTSRICSHTTLWNIFFIANYHVHEMSETIWRERLKMLRSIQPFRNSRWKSTVLRCELYLIDRQNYFHGVDSSANPHNDRLNVSASLTSQETAFSDDHQHVTFLPATLSNVHWLKRVFFTGRLGNKFVKKYDYWTFRHFSNV